MTKKPYQLGFIGGSVDSAVGYAHFAAAQMDNKWKVAAGMFSRNKEKNTSTADLCGVSQKRIYNNFSDLLNNESKNLDAVAILTPTPSHFELVEHCLDAEIPVICEKALCETSLKAMKIIEKVKNKEGFLAVVYNYSGYPMIRELRRIVAQGDLGEILHIQAEMPQEGFLKTDAKGNVGKPQDWRLVDKDIPTIHLDLGVHLHELIYYLTGLKPKKVIANQSSANIFKVIDNVNCLAVYEKNVTAQLWFSKCAIGNRNGLRIRIFGSQGSAEWYQMNPEEVIISYSNGTKQILDRASDAPVATQKRYERFKAGHPTGFIEALANLYVDFYEDLKSFKETGQQTSKEVFGAELSYEGLQMLESMVEASKSCKWQELT